MRTIVLAVALALALSGFFLTDAGAQSPSRIPQGAKSVPFDRGAAASALGSVNIQSCKKAGGPTGTGKVTVTFAPTGSVEKAEIDGPPFADTPVGGCIAGKYRGAHVPPFSGPAVPVGKSFTLN